MRLGSRNGFQEEGCLLLRPRCRELPLWAWPPHEASPSQCYAFFGPKLWPPQEDAGLQALHRYVPRHGQVPLGRIHRVLAASDPAEHTGLSGK